VEMKLGRELRHHLMLPSIADAEDLSQEAVRIGIFNLSTLEQLSYLVFLAQAKKIFS
jgi:hypothetical protein